ncbi:MAG: class I SAM-dependent methyltransferase [Thermoanaerobaculia bacterium]
MSTGPRDFRDQAYGVAAALRYSIFENRPDGFARRRAPKIRRFYEQTETGASNRDVLDLACGSGQLSAHFLKHGYRVVGLDRSPHMLRHAREACASYVDEGRALFVEGDASDFQFDRRFGLVACTFNGLNHLASLADVTRCLRCVDEALAPDGYFVFDIDTPGGLRETVDTMVIHDTDEEIIVRKRVFDGKRVILYASGCFAHNGVWHRYRETIWKIVIDPERLRDEMSDLGWSPVHYVDEDLVVPIADPNDGKVAYGVARKEAG